MTQEELEKLADDYASESDRAGTSYHIGLMRGFVDGYRKGQSNPKIKKLEWKIERIGGIVARTHFGVYEIREYDWGCILFGVSSVETAPNFKTVKEAKDKAQEHFNQKVMEYIETNDNFKNH